MFEHERSRTRRVWQPQSEAVLRSPATDTEPEMAPPVVHEVLAAAGERLDEETAATMGARYGRDFSQVRVHADARAGESADAVGARAYTVGNHIVFADGAYAPQTEQGSHLLAHELIHTLQQPLAGPAATSASLPVGAPTDPAEREAETNAGLANGGATVDLTAGVHGAALRRQTPPSGGMRPAHARGFGGEQAMGFAYPQEEWIFLGGPSGAAGHGVTTSGFDGVAVRTGGPLEIHLLDNKSLARQGNVSSATALTTNLQRNIGDLTTLVAEPRFDDVPRIGEIRTALSAARTALQTGQRLPGSVRLIVTNAGGRSTGVTGTLANQGVEFRDLNQPAPRPAPTAPPAAGTRSTGTPQGGTRSAEGEAGSGGRSSTDARVGTPSEPPIEAGPSPKGTAAIGGIFVAFQGINFVSNLINDHIQGKRAQQALDAIAPEVARNRAAHPNAFTLVVLVYSQVEAPSESLIQPGPVFSHLETGSGVTKDEARRDWQRTPQLRAAGGRVRQEEMWIPPVQQAGPAAMARPFPRAALATFAVGRAILQDVEWGGLTGFDDEGTTKLTVPADVQPRFIVMRVPSPLRWFYEGVHDTVIPVEERAAAEGGSIPVVNLDPSMPFADVSAACVFPADDDTAALFAAGPPTRDNLGHLRGRVNLQEARWVRPENIQVLGRFTD
ncbi:uncharacterized protein DUF4157 [Kitasatospora atroaurantiaca]|uniref:Uncharacterized protein DUF4157 n=2 Tax=Kitasatospora atroaurantiaca TaxID=285545 RepID=A0A561F256_9ACTN|nr:uncharacterized protein DUF4157 [Kitasatospora atroaurantiaca]